MSALHYGTMSHFFLEDMKKILVLCNVEDRS